MMEASTLSIEGEPPLQAELNTPETLLNAESFEYGEVDIPDEEAGDDDVSEDFDLAMQRLLQSNIAALKTPEPDASISRHPEVVDDYIRNFLIKMGMNKTLNMFETEWYDLKSVGKLQAVAMDRVPDAYMHNAKLSDEIISLRKQLTKANSIAAKASSTWDTFRKERDFHRMHHKRVVQEKNKLIKDIKRIKEHYEQYEPTINALKRKYEAAMREKSLIGIERDRLQQSLKQLQATTRLEDETDADTIKAARGAPAAAKTGSKSPAENTTLGATLPVGTRQNPFATMKAEPVTFQGMRMQKTFKGHSLGVAHVVLHPRKPVAATASDDSTWRLWHLPDGDLIMSGEGHKDWVAAVDFHPSGSSIASAGADCMVKIWDFSKQRCIATLRDHTAAIWSVAFHDAGEILASCSLDATIRVWDVAAAKSMLALRGHADSVNEVHWLPYTNTLASASSDKTLSLWDARAGLTSATLFGHTTSVNSVSSNRAATVLASADADGVLKTWDIRMLRESSSLAMSANALNRVRFDRSGTVAVVACDDGHVYSMDVTHGEPVADLTGHEDAVNSIATDPSGEFLISASSDCSFILWS